MPNSKTSSRAQAKPRAARKPAGPAWKRRPEYVPGFTYEQERADRVVRFIETFVTCTTGRKFAGRPMKLMPWQVDLISTLYGWVDSEGLRRYRRAAVFVSKKNGKSGLCSALVLYHLLADGEPGASVFGAAVDRIQAGIVYRSVASAVRANRELFKALEVIDSRSTIVHHMSNSRYTCLSADSWRAEGIDASAVIIDELHAHRKPDLVQALTYAGAARTQPLIISISTAGEQRNGIGYEWYLDAKLVEKDPAANPSFFGRVFEARPDDPRGFGDPEVWKEANPSLGVTISQKDFAADYADSLTSPTKTTSFLRYRLGIWAQADSRWFKGDAFSKCRAEPPVPLEGRPCVVGIDMASHNDMTAAAFLFRSDDGSWDAELLYWCPEATIAERERKDNIPYSAWVRDGWLVPTPGARLDHEVVARDILAMAERYRFVRVGADPWQVGLLATLLEKNDVQVMAVAQTTRVLSEPCKMLDGLVAEGKFRFRSPVLQWNANNAALFTDATGMVKPAKDKSTEKIDGISALAVAFAMGISAAPELERPSLDEYRVTFL